MSTTKARTESIERAMKCGLIEEDAIALRRIALTLHRWFELECGLGDEATYYVERGENGEGTPHMKRADHRGIKDLGPTPDRETGARKRLAKMMQRYPHLHAYIQTDPRGGTIYLVREGDVPAGQDVGAYYSRGVFIA